MAKIKNASCLSVKKKLINPRDQRLNFDKKNELKELDEKIREIPQVASSLFFQYNKSLGPPYHVLIDTNFINFCIRNKIDVVKGMMECLYAKCTPYITDCVMAELEKLGNKFRIALKIARDPCFERLPCSHSGTYADDCIISRIMQNRCYIVATNDKNLKVLIRRIPGVPIMYVGNHKLKVERLVGLN
ncbi:rRNA-processing protein FCF1 [Pneumocystis jirovecii RU7]|uniref:PIN domain-containing protein n=1 Tax=Pneumocystis jirovecii (strain RU7) TaxID=1408657 RepID=A0A0W4ZIK9_PNEJ7|nr:rRNA-processing protein FCF1 [Pneumocystis jirovecii RU7]KTW28207.1 hypothetical protein T551_02626 [Pneumocystis jirovecii RU7]